MSRFDESERILLAMWRRYRGTAPNEPDTIQHALLGAWRRYDRSPAARPLRVTALRHRLNERPSSSTPSTGLFGPSGYLPDSAGRVLGLVLGGSAAEALARGRPGERTTATLFTLEGLIRAHTRARTSGVEEPVHEALAGLRRWLHTRGVAWRDCVGHEHLADEPDGWLAAQELPRGITSDDTAMVTTLARTVTNGLSGTTRHPANRASSATTVPLGALGALWSNAGETVFDLGTELTALTHGDPRAHVPAGVLGVTVSGLLHGRDLRSSIRAALRYDSGDVTGPIRRAVRFDQRRPVGHRPSRRNLEAMSGGRTGAEALAIAVRVALACPDDFATAVNLAADHHGDTVTSAVLCGQLLGALNGPAIVPAAWRDTLDGLLERVAEDATAEFGPHPEESASWLRRYPVPGSPEPTASPDEPARWQRRFVGSVLGCTVGEAFGTPITTESWDDIRGRHGERGLADYVPAGHPSGRLGSDSQLLLFTLEGMIRAGVHRRNGGGTDPIRPLQHAHQRWLHTQHLSWPRAAGEFLSGTPEPDGWLVGERGLFHTRAPGRTMMRTLIAFAKGQQAMGTPEDPVSDSRGSTAVLRAVPATLWSNDPTEVFRVASNTAALTHGAPAAHLSAGALAVLVSRTTHEEPLPMAVDAALNQLSGHPGHEEVTRGVEAAARLAASGPADPNELEKRLGTGWTAPEALAIGLHAALVSGDDFDAGLRVAANHSGNSATCAAVCGGLLGAALGANGIDSRWSTDLELAETVERLAEDATLEFGTRPPTDSAWTTRYPPT
ncbi:ADP-ribosylglycohydrolase [Saccharopolyspora lacisalsi]|uniref:ADP-ribosylglycohydrolase n=1 Tax=Halosaccharopolyspora lacisalsi TaxID=1000566 RepID=A0A839DYX9_9PSEU|nr:ADP-ribosylglycohydrolase family protein [Halosaccharopolyspora lacisalsi]MBA8825436.1 ADP-ribosylglycohydrolase [Halosaccharopolyspora lacisalsi]